MLRIRHHIKVFLLLKSDCDYLQVMVSERYDRRSCVDENQGEHVKYCCLTDLTKIKTLHIVQHSE